jgi:hypothetical protein
VVVGFLTMVTGAGGIWDATTDDLAVANFVTSVTFVDGPDLAAVLPVQ